ncbi:MAG: hypothetical protein M1814_001718 [Vezdaea aestivalis]|nr:MAG: hypothetical protein M1814_001718 [Vezdaea aestivalis]
MLSAAHVHGVGRPVLATLLAHQFAVRNLGLLSAVVVRSGHKFSGAQQRAFWWGHGCSSRASSSSRYPEAVRRAYVYKYKFERNGKSLGRDESFEKELESHGKHSPKTIQRVRRIQDFKRRLDEDPYEALFGSRSLVFGGRPFLQAWMKSFSNFPGTKPTAERRQQPDRPASTPVTTDEPLLYEFDPITMRKIPKSRESTSKAITEPRVPRAIPAETTKSTKSTAETKQRRPDAILQERPDGVVRLNRGSAQSEPTNKNWLYQEGFSSDGKLQSSMQTTHSARIPQERFRKELEKAYEDIDMSVEDLDLLRSSDVKAASRIMKTPRSSESSGNRETLEAEYQASQIPSADEEVARKTIVKYQREKAQSSVARSQSKLEAELACAEGDLSGDVSVWTRSPLFNSAPASIQERAELGRQAFQKHARKSQEQALVQEIRDIYEDDYGTIDTQHRQPNSQIESFQPIDTKPRPSAQEPILDEPLDTSPDRQPTSLSATKYKILAYDPKTSSIVSSMNTSSTFDGASALSIPEVLMAINNPARFLPHFNALQKEGYELVRGSGDVVVFRRADNDSVIAPPASSAHSHESSSSTPTAAPRPESQSTSRPSSHFRTQPKVKRQEPVFSGHRLGDHDKLRSDNQAYRHKRPRRLFRRVFWTSVWAAGSVYLVGVIVESYQKRAARRKDFVRNVRGE